MLELVELEALELLEHYGYESSKCPVVRGSALLALKGKPMYSNIKGIFTRNTICGTMGRCYDHNFLRFLEIFGKKIGGFLKNQCYQIFA
jgi:hypothetical protein